MKKLYNVIGGSLYQYKTHVVLNIRSKKIVSKLSEYGIRKAKSLTLNFPDNITKKYIRHFIRGYFDGDGSIYWNKCCGYSILGTQSFLNTMNKYLPKKANVIKRNDCKIYSTQKHGKDGIKNLEWIKRGASIYLERKWNRINGIPFVAVDPAYTSQICSACGKMGDRKGKNFSCKACGNTMDADINAAKNIAARGRAVNHAEKSVKEHKGS